MDGPAYHFLLNKSYAGNSDAKWVLDGYFRGVAETLSSLSALNGGKIPVMAGRFACPPSSEAITPEMVKTALQQVIGTETNPKKIDSGLEKAPVGGLVIIGLGILFPCK